MLSRRTFLTRVAGGVVGACVVAQIPTSVLPITVRKYAALDYLRRHYNLYTQGLGKPPNMGFCGRELFDAYESELLPISRWTDNRTAEVGPTRLAFKSAMLQPAGPGWFVQFYHAEA